MKKIFTALSIIITIVAVSGCRTGSDQADNNSDLTMAQDTLAQSDSFFSKFDTISLPYSISGSSVEGMKPISIDQINQYFESKRFKPTFGTERDLPDLAENAEEAQFFQAGSFHGSGFTAIIIRKQVGSDNYYYLSTFSGKEFVDGLCIAFGEGDKNDRTERRAAINDDYSIQIMQSNILNGQVSDDAETKIFVIGSDGSISQLKTFKPGS